MPIGGHLAEPDAGRGATASPPEDSRVQGTRPRDSGTSFASRIRAAGPVSWVILTLALVAAVAMIATEFSTIASVQVKGGPPCEDVANSAAADQCVKTGGDQHSYALILLGLGTLAMGMGAALGRSRPAAAGLAVIGAIVLAIALLADLPDTRETGLIGAAYEAEAKSGPGLIYEVVAGGLAVVAGVLALTRRD